MENPFKNIIQHEELPDKIRERVIDDIALIKLSLDMADLVMVKYPAIVMDIFNTAHQNQQKKKHTTPGTNTDNTTK